MELDHSDLDTLSFEEIKQKAIEARERAHDALEELRERVGGARYREMPVRPSSIPKLQQLRRILAPEFDKDWPAALVEIVRDRRAVRLAMILRGDVEGDWLGLVETAVADPVRIEEIRASIAKAKQERAERKAQREDEKAAAYEAEIQRQRADARREGKLAGRQEAEGAIWEAADPAHQRRVTRGPLVDEAMLRRIGRFEVSKEELVGLAWDEPDVSAVEAMASIALRYHYGWSFARVGYLLGRMQQPLAEQVQALVAAVMSRVGLDPARFRATVASGILPEGFEDAVEAELATG